MAGQLGVTPKLRFFNPTTGEPLASGTVATKVSGTNTDKATYPTKDDADNVTNANSNPLTLNAAGEPSVDVWLLNDQRYRFIIKDSEGNTVDTIDNITGVGSTSYQGGSILDSSNNELVTFGEVADSTDYITITNGDGTSSNPIISSAGDSTNVNLEINTQGAASNLQLNDLVNIGKQSGTGAITLTESGNVVDMAITGQMTITGTLSMSGTNSVFYADKGLGFTESGGGSDKLIINPPASVTSGGYYMTLPDNVAVTNQILLSSYSTSPKTHTFSFVTAGEIGYDVDNNNTSVATVTVDLDYAYNTTTENIHNRLLIHAVTPVTDGAYLTLTTSDDGAVFDTGASDYEYSVIASDSSGTDLSYESTGDSKVVLMPTSGQGNLTPEYGYLEMDIFRNMIMWRFGYGNASGALVQGSGAAKVNVASYDSNFIEALKFAYNTGNITAMRYSQLSLGGV